MIREIKLYFAIRRTIKRLKEVNTMKWSINTIMQISASFKAFSPSWPTSATPTAAR